MKHPAYKRILSAVLAVVLLLSCVPGSIFANETAPFRVVSPDGGAGLVELPRNCRTVLTAVDAPDGADLQWQIAMPDDQGWVDISGQEEATLTVSIAMFASVMDENSTASIRCAAIQGDSEYFTDPIQIQSTAPVMMDPPEETYPQVYEETMPEPIWEIFPESTEETTPETTVPETTVPETTVPETTVPETTVPETTVPETTVPETTVPETTVPETTVPETTVPETTAPTEDVMFEIVTEEEFSLVSGKPRIADNGGQPSSASGTINQIHTVTIEYYYKEEDTTSDTLTQVWDSFTATIEHGASLQTNVPNKYIPGYAPWVEEHPNFELETDTQGNGTYIAVNIGAVNENITFKVYYKKVDVPYYARYFLQNIVNDLYTEDSELYSQFAGRANERPKEENINKTIPGFTSLFYEPDFVAADGSTVFEVYYDRNYYLINFELGGGYGVEPIYARYEYPLHVGEPTKPGYRFAGWELVKVNGQPATAEQKEQAFPTTIPYENRTYRAIWETVDTTYTVVYWRENPDDDGYSYWTSVQKEGKSATYVNGSDDLAYSTTDSKVLAEITNFTYNDVRTDKNVLIEGDGTTVVNVYYSRNYYTLYFVHSSEKCVLEEHAHGTNCEKRLICGGASHIHDATCNGRLVCTVTEHAIHDDTCLTCTLPEHLQHTASCLICGKTEHPAHTQACCTLTVHTHGTGCYSLIGGSWGSQVTSGNTISQLENPDEENVSKTGIVRISEWWGYSNSYYYKIGNTWYQINNINNNNWQTVTVTQACTEQEHTHGDGCICNNELHTHTESCYRDSIHTHTKSCYKDEIHVHTDDCYSYDCSQTAHVHTDACYGDCTKPTHTHTNNCHVFFAVTAKYDSNITSVWETGKVKKKLDAGIVFKSSITQKYYSFLEKMPKQNITMTATEWSGNKYTWYYYLQTYDGMDTSGETTRTNNGVEYYLYHTTSVNGSGISLTYDEDYFPITGFTQRDRTVPSFNNNRIAYLYYIRNSYKLGFTNYGQILKNEEKMYQIDISGEYFVPPYPPPTVLEQDAYVFTGWYTTPEFLPGTEYDFTGKTMPAQDIMLYAKWEPITRTIEFYNTYDHMMGLTTDKAPIDTKTVKHGAFMTGAAPIPIHPQNDAEGTRYSFVGWFYMDENGQKVAFEPSEMEIRQNLKLYAEWKSPITTQYTISYKVMLEDGTKTEQKLADDMAGYTFVAGTKTFSAKAGEDLNLLEGDDKTALWLPHTNSHSILMKEEPKDNVFTFWYVKKEKAPYVVRYLEAGTNIELSEEKKEPDNRSSIVTETFRYIDGYTPDAFHKRLVLSAKEDENVIIFYYTKASDGEEQQAPYQVTHYIQNADGNGYSVYTEEAPRFDDVGTRITVDPITIPGYNHVKADCLTADGETTKDNTLPKEGLQFKLYYDRLKYSYKVEYYDISTGNLIPQGEMPGGIHNPTEKPQDYYFDTEVTEKAPVIPGYTLVGDETDTLKISSDTNRNVIKFYYEPKQITVNYVTVCTIPDLTNYGYVMDKSRESLSANQLNDPNAIQGATPYAQSGYRFVGWYATRTDTGEVQDLITNTQVNPQTKKLIPVITQDDLTAKDEANQPYEFTYYALFEPITQSLTITKQGGKEGDTFLFHVKDLGEGIASADVIVSIQGNGSVTINDLYCGEYSVQELTAWCWTYTAEQYQQTVLLNGQNATVTFKNNYQTPDWLHGENHCENQFEPIT